jgi:hypothetical protein
MDEIQQFSLELANSLVKCTLEDYFKAFHDNFYKDENIEFMGYFLSLIPKRKEFCVEHVKLQEYKVVNNLITSANILRALKQYDLEEGIDFNLFNVEQVRENRGTVNTKQYMLTPNAFKLCLIRAKNSKAYAKYYMRYEEMYYYYKYYQTEYQNKVLSMKDDKIDNLEKKMDEVLKENKEQSCKMDDQAKRIEELLNYGKKTTEKLDEVKEELNDMSEEFENLNEQFDDLHEKVDDMKDAFEETANRSVPDPEKETDKSEYILLQSRDNFNEFIFIRGIKKDSPIGQSRALRCSYNDKKMINRYNEDYEIVAREFNSNPIQLLKLFKKIVKDELKETRDAIKNNKTLKGQKMRLKKKLKKLKLVVIKLNY